MGIEKRTPVAEAVSAAIYGTANPVPFVGRFISQAPAVNEKLPLLAKVTSLKTLIWTGVKFSRPCGTQATIFARES